MTVPGQTAAQSAAQPSRQQSARPWLAAMPAIVGDRAIGQSCAAAATAGAEKTAIRSASQKRSRSRRMGKGYRKRARPRN